MWHIGQKVVCIDDHYDKNKKISDLDIPHKDHIYTIEKVIDLTNPPLGLVYFNIPKDIKYAFSFFEIKNHYTIYFFENHFRPVEYKTVEDLNGLLNNLPSKICVDEFEEMMKDRTTRKHIKEKKIVPEKINS